MTLPKSPREFVERSNWKGIRALAQDILLLVILIFIGIFCDSVFINLLLLWPIGLIQFCMGESLAHEASHYSLFKNRKWNDWGEWVYSIPFLFTIDAYRTEHLKHHTRFGKPSEDHLVSDYECRGLFKVPPRLIWIWFAKPLLGFAGFAYIKSTFFELMSTRSAVKLIAFWGPLVTLCVVGGGLSLLVWYWILPLFWTYSSFLWWSEIRDHFNTRNGTRSDLSWMNVLTHNNGYHDVHHRYPSIPWYRLPEAHEELCSEEDLDVCYGFFDAFKQLRTPIQETPNKKGTAGQPISFPAGQDQVVEV